MYGKCTTNALESCNTCELDNGTILQNCTVPKPNIQDKRTYCLKTY